MNVAVFETAEQKIRGQILRNLLASDGKKRSYFDVMRGVDMSSDLATPVFTSMLCEGIFTVKFTTLFPSGNRAPVQVPWYRGNLRKVRELLGDQTEGA